MGIAHAVPVAASLLVALGAQQQRAQLYDWRDLTPRFPPPAEDSVRALDRFARIAVMLLEAENPADARKRPLVSAVANAERLIAHTMTAEQAALLRGMLEQLRQQTLPRARLQCSLLTMPQELAKAHGLAAARFVATDEAAFGKLVRAAVAAGGTLQNLPEVVAEPLAPFVFEPKAGPGKARAEPALRLRGELVPVGASEIACSVQLVRGALPPDLTHVPKQALLDAVVRLEAGKAAMKVVVSAEPATVVVFVRCLEITVTGDAATATGR